MLWPDVVVDDRTGRETDRLHASSCAARAFGTTEVARAAETAAALQCSVHKPVANALSAEDLRGAVYPPGEILECACVPEPEAGTGLRCPSAGEVFQMLESAAGLHLSGGQENYCRSWKYPVGRSFGVLTIWLVSLTTAGCFVLIVCVEQLLMARSKLQPHWQPVPMSYLAYIYISFILLGSGVGVVVAWATTTGSKGAYEARVARIGNMCVAKAPNLYAGELSSNVLVVFVCSVGFSVAPQKLALVYFSGKGQWWLHSPPQQLNVASGDQQGHADGQ